MNFGGSYLDRSLVENVTERFYVQDDSFEKKTYSYFY